MRHEDCGGVGLEWYGTGWAGLGGVGEKGADAFANREEGRDDPSEAGRPEMWTLSRTHTPPPRSLTFVVPGGSLQGTSCLPKPKDD